MRMMRKRKKKTGKRLARLLLIVLVAAMVSPFHLGNGYLRSNDFATVQVARKDNVWTIASRYTAKSEDVDELVEAIIEVNGLPADGSLRAGQSLRVPILKDRLPKLAGK